MARQFPIHYDGMAVFLVLVASSELVFAGTTIGIAGLSSIGGVSLFAVAMMTVGIVDERLAKSGGELPVEGSNPRRTKKSLMYVAASISVFFALGAFTKAIPVFAQDALKALSLSTVPLGTVLGFSQMFVLLIAVAEESFFRGLWANIFISRMGLPLGAVSDATFFTVYHLLSYGDALFTTINGQTFPSPSAFAIWGAGVTLTCIDFKTGVISTSMLGHVLNNAFSAEIIPIPGVATHLFAPVIAVLGPAMPMFGTVIFTVAVLAIQLKRGKVQWRA